MGITLDSELIAKLMAPVLSLLAGAVIKKLRPAVRLVTYYGHIGDFQVKPMEGANDKLIKVHTHSVVVLNQGSEPAHDVRLVHNLLPHNITLNPPISHTINPGENNTGEILIPILSPKEQVTVSYLYYPPITYGQINAFTKCDEGLAKFLRALPTPQPSNAVKWTAWALVFLGTTLVFYFAARVAIYALAVW